MAKTEKAEVKTVLKIGILEMKKGEKLPTLATFKARLSVGDEPIITLPGLRLVENEGVQFVAPQDHYHFKIKAGKDKGKTKYVHCYYPYQNTMDAILPFALAEFSNLSVIKEGDSEKDQKEN